MPVKGTARLAPFVPLTVSDQVRVPVAVGVKVTLKMQDDPPATPALVPGEASTGQLVV